MLITLCVIACGMPKSFTYLKEVILITTYYDMAFYLEATQSSPSFSFRGGSLLPTLIELNLRNFVTVTIVWRLAPACLSAVWRACSFEGAIE